MFRSRLEFQYGFELELFQKTNMNKHEQPRIRSYLNKHELCNCNKILLPPLKILFLFSKLNISFLTGYIFILIYN